MSGGRFFKYLALHTVLTSTHNSMRLTVLFASLMLALLTSCKGADDAGKTTDGDDSAPVVVPVRSVASLVSAASWVGDIPCADCESIRTTVTLHPDGLFQSEGIYLRTKGAGDTIFSDFGRWTHSDSARRVQLRGSSGAPGLFSAEPDGSIRMLGLNGEVISSRANYNLVATPNPVAITHPTRLVGAFTYMADAAIFVECASGLQFPVHMSVDYLKLETAYSRTGRAGSPVVVRLKGHLENRPAMEGDGETLSLIVDSMDRIDPADGCAALRTLNSVAAGSWRLVSIARDSGSPEVPSDSKANLNWDRSAGRFTGNSGCNQFSAPAVLRGTTVVGQPATSTRMFCEGAMELEARFLALIGEGGSLRIDTDTLVWSQGPRDVARFVRQ